MSIIQFFQLLCILFNFVIQSWKTYLTTRQASELERKQWSRCDRRYCFTVGAKTIHLQWRTDPKMSELSRRAEIQFFQEWVT